MNPWIAKAVVLAASVVMVVIRAPHGRRSRRVTIVRDRKGRLETILLILAMLGFVVPLVWMASPVFSFADYPLRSGPLAAGTGCFVVGLWLFYRSHADLGENWSVTLQVRAEHRLVTDGVDRPGDLPSGRHRQLGAAERTGLTLPQEGVEQVHACRGHGDPHLGRRRLGQQPALGHQHLGTADGTATRPLGQWHRRAIRTIRADRADLCDAHGTAPNGREHSGIGAAAPSLAGVPARRRRDGAGARGPRR